MKRIRPHHLALIASGAVTCLMVGLLLGIVAAGGHVSRVLAVIHDAPPPAATAHPTSRPIPAPPPQPDAATARRHHHRPPGPPPDGRHHRRHRHHDDGPEGDLQS
jgi:hypothetical protein